MKKYLFIILSFTFIISHSVFAQKAKKDKKDKEKIGVLQDQFLYDQEKSENYKKEDRSAVSKPTMPRYDADQDFHVSKKRIKQQDAYQDRKYFFPAKPHNAWQIGVFGGFSTLSGDVTPNFMYGNKPALPGHNFGLHVTKAWSYMFSTRLRYSTLTMFTNDATASTLTNEQYANVNQRSSGLYGYTRGQQFFHNSRTQGHDLNLDFIISFGNLAFHKERTNFNFKIFPAVGMLMYQTFYDHYDENGNVYDYNSLANLNNLNERKRSDILKDLSAMRDGKYETRAEQHTVADENKLLGYNPRFVFGIGGGFTFRLTKFLYLDIETRQMLMRDDLLDGMQWQEPEGASAIATSKGQTRNFDSYNQTTVGLTFNFVGKKTAEPLTMLNPMHYSYQKVAEADPQAAIDDLLKDDDADGVPNRLDQEEATVTGAQVDPKGIALDSDKDGIIDFNDNEPFSPPGYPVDDKGVAIGNFANKLQESLGVIEKDGQLGYIGGDGKFVAFDKNNSVFNGMGGGGATGGCSAGVELPSVHFDKDKYNIKPEYYAHLHQVAQKLLSCPNSKVMATGMADKDNDTKYNEQLSYNRVDAVVDYLVATYGLDRERFIVTYEGEKTAKGTSAVQQYEDRKVDFKLVEKADGKSNPSEPHPGMKAGSGK